MNTAKRNEKEKGLFSDPRCHGTRSLMGGAEIMGRIRCARPDSPIIVYKGSERGTYTTAFAATVRGQRDVERGYSKNGERVLGSWHSSTSEVVIRDVLAAAWGIEGIKP